jgi:3-oxoadipate enol-lactonase
MNDFLLTNDGLRLHYRLDGVATGPVLVFSNSLGSNLHMWDSQVAALGSLFRIIRYDTRGHGQSHLTAQVATPVAQTSLELLGNDLLTLLNHLQITKAHICGISLGGLTAQWLAIHQPERVDRLILAHTASRIGSTESWDTRIATVLSQGMAAISDAVIRRWFSESFLRQQPALAAAYHTTLASTSVSGYAACCYALRDANVRPLLSKIAAATLVIAGALDEPTPPTQAEEIHAAIARSKLAIVPAAAHLSNVEFPNTFNDLLYRFLRA